MLGMVTSYCPHVYRKFGVAACTTLHTSSVACVEASKFCDSQILAMPLTPLAQDMVVRLAGSAKVHLLHVEGACLVYRVHRVNRRMYMTAETPKTRVA